MKLHEDRDAFGFFLKAYMRGLGIERMCWKKTTMFF